MSDYETDADFFGIGLAGIVFLIIVLMFVFDSDAEPVKPDCELVQMWQDGELESIEPHNRNGRPAINQQEREQCLNNKEQRQ